MLCDWEHMVLVTDGGSVMCDWEQMVLGTDVECVV